MSHFFYHNQHIEFLADTAVCHSLTREPNHCWLQGDNVWTVKGFCEVFHITVVLGLMAESVSLWRGGLI